MDNMTALVSCFARAYHYKNCERYVFADPAAEQMLTAEEYGAISRNMTQGIRYFAPDFQGTQEEALHFIVDHQLAPSVLTRSAFCERAVGNAVRLLGCRQVMIYACGYDTFSLRTDDRALTVYELDRPEMIADRWKRIARTGLEPACHVEDIGCDLSRPSWKEKLIQAGFNPKKTSFGSLLGISYYLSRQDFKNLIAAIASISCEGSSICFDYPVSEAGAESQRNRELAAAAGEMMKAKYSYEEMEALLSNTGFLIYEHMDAGEATDAFLKESGMTAPAGVGYCLAVRKG
ncbi:MAG: class I SAM-dependent methyltransferase [Clostridia bacterium]|nr:class I SAM-dependent methyltransferase [Clostridia bacterium]